MTFALSTLDGLDSALARARHVTASSYRLPVAIESELAAAARRGASVDVALARGPAGKYDGALAAENAAVAARLGAAGAHVRLVDGEHVKAMVVDGVAWLDDRNFARRGPSIVVRDDDPTDVAAVAVAIARAGSAPRDGSAGDVARGGSAPLALTKADAIERERVLLAGAPATGVSLASENFENGEISHALRACRAAGEPVRLLVDGREARAPAEAAALAALAAAGVEIRTAAAVDKVALAGDSAWIGSANATYAGPRLPQQSDWGAVTDDAAIVAELRGRFDRAWDASDAWRAAATATASR